MLPSSLIRNVVRPLRHKILCSYSTSSFLSARRWKEKTELTFQSELKNPMDQIFGGDFVPEKGKVYDKKPFKVSVKKYHLYHWCGCGLSHTQPFCDRTHANKRFRKFLSGGPVKYIAPEDKDIWFCNCKQTENRPFCDGSHRDEAIQELIIPGKIETLWEPNTKKGSKGN